ncbi:MAG: nucleotide exchange factor GrpE, partial [Bacilli bacterium]|nr:nucleotide exchange factor GrpE [Bacilli bacterium]
KQLEVEKKYAAVDLIKKLLVPLSYFESALKYQSDDQAIMNFLKGFEMIYNLILDTLKSDGLEEIVTNVNDIFDPYYHEVTELVETDGEKDRIVEVVQKGYKYKDRVIKPVKVKVSKPIQKLEDSEDKNNNETQDNSELVN